MIAPAAGRTKPAPCPAPARVDSFAYRVRCSRQALWRGRRATGRRARAIVFVTAPTGCGDAPTDAALIG
ncbi:hypothetical protein [Actinomadura chokoriensis]|uniref:Uncharacterized protein n=1 Tax=Actinomadura chokoriensis TaxID=454156 RepID=A0ABV4R5M3_9ACTN